MTNQAQSISRDLREEIHHHAQGSIGLGLLRQTSSSRVDTTLGISPADEGWLRAHFGAEVWEAATEVVAMPLEGGKLPTLSREAEEHARLASLDRVLLVLWASSRLSAGGPTSTICEGTGVRLT